MFAGSSGFGSQCLGTATISPPQNIGFVLYLNGQATPALQSGSMVIDSTLNQRGTASFTLINPATIPEPGWQVIAQQDEDRLFCGTIDRVQVTADPTQNAVWYACDCVDLSQILDHLVWTQTYISQSSKQIMLDIFRNKLTAEGLVPFVIDQGSTFPLFDNQELTVTDIVRGVADGSGMIWWIDPYRGMHMVVNPYDAAPFGLGVGVIANPQGQKTRDRYVNVMRVTCTGINGNKVTIERADTVQIAARQALEGGTGRYEVPVAISHPSSDVGTDLQRLAISYAVIQLKKSGSVAQQLTGVVYQPGLKVGMTVAVTLPSFDAVGTWLLTNVKQSHRSLNDWQWEITALATSALELAIDYYLKTVQAGKATVQLPIGIFANIAELTTSQSWAVPGSGDVDVEIDCFGCGGGGGGYDGLGVNGVTPVVGGAGGTGGKATTFVTVPAGTLIDVVIPTTPTGGVGAEPPSVVTFNSSTTWTVPGTGNVRVNIVANGAGGGGCGCAKFFSTFQSGLAGGSGGKATTTRVIPAGTVLTIVVGGAGAGGAFFDMSLNACSTGYGGDGGLSKVTDGGATIYAQGNGGQHGTQSNDHSNSCYVGPVPNAGGSGDAVVTGGGGAGGAGAPAVNGANGSAGANGSVIITWCDSDPGVTGASVTASIGGTLKASALSGIGGAAGCDGGALGANQGGTGDQVVVGGGGAGGTGGHSGNVNGQSGTAAKVQIRY